MASPAKARRGRGGAAWGPWVLGLCCGLLLGGGSVSAEDAPEAARPEPSPTVGLDTLLKLPDSVQFDVERRGGATRGEWRERFRVVRSDLAREQEALQSARLALEKAASSADAWRFSPPGMGNVTDSPVDYQLREEVRRREAEVTRLETELRELEVEANLAGVPEEWRE